MERYPVHQFKDEHDIGRISDTSEALSASAKPNSPIKRPFSTLSMRLHLVPDQGVVEWPLRPLVTNTSIACTNNGHPLQFLSSPRTWHGVLWLFIPSPAGFAAAGCVRLTAWYVYIPDELQYPDLAASMAGLYRPPNWEGGERKDKSRSSLKQTLTRHTYRCWLF